jgi:predicted dehydrogenase
VLQAARAALDRIGGAPKIQHVQYEMTRVGRTDPDFTLTAIHAIDAARFLAGSDYAALRFTYAEPDGGTPGVVNYLVTGSFESGASVHVACVPAAGVVVERAVVHAGAYTLFAQVPMWAAFDAPGRLQILHEGRLVEEHDGRSDVDQRSAEAGAFIAGGFLAQYLAFFEALRDGRRPSPDLDAARQSVEVTDAMRQRRQWFAATGPLAPVTR